MKKFQVILALLAAMSFAGQAAKVELKFNKPDKFVDIRAGDANQARYREDVFYNIEKHLNKLAAKLPEDYTLKVEVNDLDLAGDVRFSGGRALRVISEPFAPRIAFSYQLLDGNDAEVSQGSENIRDTSFMTLRSLRHKRENLGFEKSLLDDWFKDTFPSLIAKNN